MPARPRRKRSDAEIEVQYDDDHLEGVRAAKDEGLSKRDFIRLKHGLLDARDNQIREIIDSLAANEREMVLKILRDVRDVGELKGSLALSQIWEIDYARKPVPVQTFLDDEYYLGKFTPGYTTERIGGHEEEVWTAFDQWRRDLIEVFAPGSVCFEWLMGGSIGCGKTFTASLALAYLIYRMSCLHNPQRYYGLAHGSKIVYGMYSVTKSQATDVGYDYIRMFVDEAPYFEHDFNFNRKLLKSIHFLNHNIRVSIGSRGFHALGQNLFSLCYSGRTYAWTEDGPVLLRSMIERPRRLWTFDPATERVYLTREPIRAVRTGVAALRRITLRSGQVLECTPNEKIMCSISKGVWNWRYAGDLQIGDLIRSTGRTKLHYADVPTVSSQRDVHWQSETYYREEHGGVWTGSGYSAPVLRRVERQHEKSYQQVRTCVYEEERTSEEDTYVDEIVAIEVLDPEPVYDPVNVPGTHSFFAGSNPSLPFVCGSNTLDEANFMQQVSARNKDAGAVGQAEELYNNTQRRLRSRYLRPGGTLPGMVILMSSKRDTEAFLERRKKEGQTAGDVAANRMKVSEYSVWEVRPRVYGKSARFYVEVGDRMYPSRVLDADTILAAKQEAREGTDIIEVPMELKGQFLADVDQALRDLAGVATYGMAPLIRERHLIERCVTKEWQHPFSKDQVSVSISDKVMIDDFFDPATVFQVARSVYIPRIDPHMPRFVHVDIGITGDALGFAVAHVHDMKSTRIVRKDGTWYHNNMPTVYIDMMLRVTPPRKGEIDFSKIRAFIFSLRDAGMPITWVTADGFQCFTGNTKVRLLNGTTATMKELADTYGRDREFWVYSYDHDTGCIVPGRGRNARVTGRKQICRVTLDNGKVVRCTLDHRWMMRDGTYRRADALQSGDSLMPLYTRLSSRSKTGLSGYEQVLQPNGRWQFTHRMVANEFPYGKRYGGIVHHVDFNRRNNDPSNLTWMSGDDHLRLHAKYAGKFGFGDPTYWTDERRRAQSALVKRLHVNPAYHANALRNLVPGQTSPLQREKASARAKARNVPGENAPRRLKHITADLVIQTAFEFENDTQRELGRRLGVSQDVIAARLEECGVGKARGWRERLNRRNHKVVSVEVLDEYEDVYDIEVDTYHNFALEAGVFVHNSRDLLQIMHKSGFNVQVLSVDRTDEQYLSLKQSVLDARVFFYRHEWFLKELSSLERDIDNNKVDHPARFDENTPGSKDIADAVCGAHFMCITCPDALVQVGYDKVVAGSQPTTSDILVDGSGVAWDDIIAARDRMKGM